MTRQGGSHGPFHQVPLASTRIEEPRCRSQLPWLSSNRQPQKRSSGLWNQRNPTNGLCALSSEEKREKEETEEVVKWNTYALASATNSGSQETKGTMFDSIQTPLAPASPTSSETPKRSETNCSQTYQTYAIVLEAQCVRIICISKLMYYIYIIYIYIRYIFHQSGKRH